MIDTFPRLEIRWFEESDSTEEYKHFRADYMLVISAPDKLDIRSNVFSETGESYGARNVEYVLGSTHARGGFAQPIDYDGNLRTPFRDGVHILRDAMVLNLPTYVSYGDLWNIVEPVPPLNVPADTY